MKKIAYAVAALLLNAGAAYGAAGDPDDIRDCLDRNAAPRFATGQIICNDSRLRYLDWAANSVFSVMPGQGAFVPLAEHWLQHRERCMQHKTPRDCLLRYYVTTLPWWYAHLLHQIRTTERT